MTVSFITFKILRVQRVFWKIVTNYYYFLLKPVKCRLGNFARKFFFPCSFTDNSDHEADRHLIIGLFWWVVKLDYKTMFADKVYLKTNARIWKFRIKNHIVDKIQIIQGLFLADQNYMCKYFKQFHNFKHKRFYRVWMQNLL